MSAMLRLLLIDCQSVPIDKIRSMLCDRVDSFEIAEACQADHQLRNNAFDCVLLGPHSPVECLRAIAPTLAEQSVPVVILSEQGEALDAMDGLEGVIPEILELSALGSPSLYRTIERAIKITSLRKQLAHVEIRLHQALTAANVGIYDWDVRTNEVYVSPQLTAQLGYLPNETWQGLDDWKDSLHPEDRDSAIGRVHEYLDGRTETYNSTFRLAHRNGTYRWILSLGCVLRDGNGAPMRFIGVHIDITERKRHEEELERSYLEIRQFAHAVSHDLQEPLTSISRHAQLIQRALGDRLDEPIGTWLENIISSAERQKSLIADLEVYTSLESETAPLEDVDCQTLVEVVRKGLADEIEHAGVTLTIERLPIARGHRRRLFLLFEALIRNAIQFRHPERPGRICVLEEDDEPGQWRFCVVDNGIGVEPRHRDAIFQVFRRLHHRDQHCGNGIGLSLCRRIVERLGGCIWVEDTPGGGSTFCFTIPKRPEKSTATSDLGVPA